MLTVVPGTEPVLVPVAAKEVGAGEGGLLPGGRGHGWVGAAGITLDGGTRGARVPQLVGNRVIIAKGIIREGEDDGIHFAIVVEIFEAGAITTRRALGKVIPTRRGNGCSCEVGEADARIEIVRDCACGN